MSSSDKKRRVDEDKDAMSRDVENDLQLVHGRFFPRPLKRHILRMLPWYTAVEFAQTSKASYALVCGILADTEHLKFGGREC